MLSTPRPSVSVSPSRRAFLRYVGFGVATGAGLGPLLRAGTSPQAIGTAFPAALGVSGWTAVGYPLPLPGDGGSAETDPRQFARFTVQDDLVLPPGFRYDVVCAWGDRFGPAGRQVTVGFNHDYTGIVPIAGSPDEFFLIVNHEYISARPWVQGYPAVRGEPLTDGPGAVGGIPLTQLSINLLDPAAVAALAPATLGALRRLCTAGMDDLGVSVLRVRRDGRGRFTVVADAPDHFRVSGAGVQNFDPSAMRFSGPAAPMLGTPRGTFACCSGATTPWGTFLVCEENFQDQVPEFVTPAGRPLPGDRKLLAGLGEAHPSGLPFEFEGLGTGLEPPLDGRQYGWVVEIDPVRRTLVKHTTLARFRHENVALRAEPGKPLAAYMGDDRRGGHVWKFVSDEPVTDPSDSSTARLFERGTLYVAVMNADFTGRWVPLVPGTPLARPDPRHYASGHLWLPHRPGGGHIAVGIGGATTESSPRRWVAGIERFAGKPFDDCTLGDLCERGLTPAQKQAVLLMDAYVMANAAGGTPTARPEDIEVHPIDQSVYIAFTDSTGSGDGSPDVRIFPDSRGENSRQYGGIWRLVERDNDPGATEFTWGRFVASGECADGGGGFACADNLVFDPDTNLWMVCDITTPRHNFPVTRTPDDRTQPGGSGFVGVFGNNALFMIPTAGPFAGVPLCFGIGPMECEFCGPTFTPDGRSLLLAVQHPGELHGTRGLPGIDQPTEVTRAMRLAARDGRLFTQERVVPLGSNFPAHRPGAHPRPCVVCITRA